MKIKNQKSQDLKEMLALFEKFSKQLAKESNVPIVKSNSAIGRERKHLINSVKKISYNSTRAVTPSGNAEEEYGLLDPKKIGSSRNRVTGSTQSTQCPSTPQKSVSPKRKLVRQVKVRIIPNLKTALGSPAKVTFVESNAPSTPVKVKFATNTAMPSSSMTINTPCSPKNNVMTQPGKALKRSELTRKRANLTKAPSIYKVIKANYGPAERQTPLPVISTPEALSPAEQFLDKVRQEDELLNARAKVVFDECDKSLSKSSRSSYQAMETDLRMSEVIAESKSTVASYVEAENKFNKVCKNRLSSRFRRSRNFVIKQPKQPMTEKKNKPTIRINLDQLQNISSRNHTLKETGKQRRAKPEDFENLALKLRLAEKQKSYSTKHFSIQVGDLA